MSFKFSGFFTKSLYEIYAMSIKPKIHSICQIILILLKVKYLITSRYSLKEISFKNFISTLIFCKIADNANIYETIPNLQITFN